MPFDDQIDVRIWLLVRFHHYWLNSLIFYDALDWVFEAV